MNQTENEPKETPHEGEKCPTLANIDRAREYALRNPVDVDKWNPDDTARYAFAQPYERLDGLYSIVCIVIVVRTEHFIGWRVESQLVNRMTAKPLRVQLMTRRQKEDLNAINEMVLSHNPDYRHVWFKRQLATSRCIETALSTEDHLLVVQYQMEKEDL